MKFRILVYQEPNSDWEQAIKDYKDEGYLLGRDVYTRRTRCYKGTERCNEVWTVNDKIASDYLAKGVPNGFTE